MSDPVSALLGPLAGPECKRALGRGWLIVVRTLAGSAALLVATSVFWWGWISIQVDPDFQPYRSMIVGVEIVEGILLAIALIMAPALMAGSLAGEKERGSLGLLLTTRVNAFDIVAGRLAAKFSQTSMMVLAAIPALALPAGIARMHPLTIVVLILYPLAIAFGGAGLSSAASAISRRGRDALLAIYLLLFVFLLCPLIGGAVVPLSGLSALNPFDALDELTWLEDPRAALRTSLVWIVMGIIGISIASWRLRASCIRQSDGARRSGNRRWLRIPPVGDRPMLWKELYTERIGSMGRVGRWIGRAMLVLLMLAGTILAVGIALSESGMSDAGFAGLYGWVGWFVDVSSFPLMCLIQWSIGLRAAVTIASERERGTWDGLLTSPLEGREIVVGKLWGSLHAMRWLIISAFWAWGLGWAGGFLDWMAFLTLASHTLLVGAYMAAVGVRASLSTATATKAMSITIGFWLLGYGAAVFAAGAVSAIWILLGLLAWGAGATLQIIDTSRPPAFFFGSIGVVFLLSLVGSFVVAAMLIVSEARLRFDRIAGRLSGGEMEVAVDQLLHGRPIKPLFSGKEIVARENPAAAEV